MEIVANDRFFASTRGRIVAMLRQSDQTVEELAGRLGLTDNAVRAHLVSLQVDGLLEPSGQRRSGGKPAIVYRLTPVGESLFPKPYAPLLGLLLDTLAERFPAAMEPVCSEVGLRLAQCVHGSAPLEGPLIERATRAQAMLNEMGGMAELREAGGVLFLDSARCPLAFAAVEHPEVCRLTESFLSAIGGVPMMEACERGDQVRCIFAVGPAVGSSD